MGTLSGRSRRASFFVGWGGSESDARLLDLTLKGRKANGVIYRRILLMSTVHVGQAFSLLSSY